MEHFGPNNIPNKLETPVEIFKCLVSDQDIEHISFQTNLYAIQKQESFVPTTPKKIRTILATNIMMEIKRLPTYRDY